VQGDIKLALVTCHSLFQRLMIAWTISPSCKKDKAGGISSNGNINEWKLTQGYV